MRIIDTIVIHHSVTPRICNTKRTLNSFNNRHRELLHPKPNSLGQHIAYHYVIANNGEIIPTRGLHEIGYHAGDLEINKKSIGICLIGNFSKDNPSDEQYRSLERLTLELQNKFNISSIFGHRSIKVTECPGINISNDYIYGLLKKKIIINKKIMNDKYKKWAIDNKICRDENWDKTPTKYETIIMINRADQPTSLKEEFVSHGTSMAINLVGAGMIAGGLYQTGMGGQAALLTAISTVFVLQSGSRATLDKVFNTIVSKFKK